MLHVSVGVRNGVRAGRCAGRRIRRLRVAHGFDCPWLRVVRCALACLSVWCILGEVAHGFACPWLRVVKCAWCLSVWCLFGRGRRGEWASDI